MIEGITGTEKVLIDGVTWTEKILIEKSIKPISENNSPKAKSNMKFKESKSLG